ncbi:MAG: alpha/beta fold hydrolase, partial [Cyclobacteriaceae bacterium]|nr:alpha/beta fold hydrolase [Cyclobacteriaceae bacterium]
MSKLFSTDYKSPGWLFNGHLQTVIPAMMRSAPLKKPYTRIRIATPDDDFLDLDTLVTGSRSVVVLSHGLEGNSSRAYMTGMANAMVAGGHDVVAWNFRGCSGEMNRQPVLYHSGATHDLQTVIDHIGERYDEIYLVGFSLGGNLTLKYLGETARSFRIKKAVVFSVPLDLKAGAEHLARPSNYLYQRRFLRSLDQKIRAKQKQFPGLLQNPTDVATIFDFDDRYTAPLHGFGGAVDYYAR